MLKSQIFKIKTQTNIDSGTVINYAAKVKHSSLNDADGYINGSNMHHSRGHCITAAIAAVTTNVVAISSYKTVTFQ